MRFVLIARRLDLQRHSPDRVCRIRTRKAQVGDGLAHLQRVDRPIARRAYQHHVSGVLDRLGQQPVRPGFLERLLGDDIRRRRQQLGVDGAVVEHHVEQDHLRVQAGQIVDDFGVIAVVPRISAEVVL